jgi:hypothetical protein
MANAIDDRPTETGDTADLDAAPNEVAGHLNAQRARLIATIAQRANELPDCRTSFRNGEHDGPTVARRRQRVSVQGAGGNDAVATNMKLLSNNV